MCQNEVAVWSVLVTPMPFKKLTDLSVAHVESSSRKRTPTRANGNEDIAKTWETQDDEDRPALPAGFVKQWSTQVDNAVAEVKALRNISTTGLARHIVDYTIDSMMSEANAISRAITDANAKDWQSGNDRVASFNMLLRSHQDPVTLNLALNLKMQLMEAELDKSRREADIRDKVTISSALERAENNGSGP
ncbi:hypothetical protein EMMF5_001790 [Cystobasidiomycetes sp. EMM_F5]